MQVAYTYCNYSFTIESFNIVFVELNFQLYNFLKIIPLSTLFARYTV